jgi:DNA-binding Lrp family transcriptional regulator
MIMGRARVRQLAAGNAIDKITAYVGLRAIGERGNSLLKMTFRALRNVSLDPWRIGAIVAAALALLHYDHAGTT